MKSVFFMLTIMLIETTICFPATTDLKLIQAPEGFQLVQGDMMVETGIRNADIKTTKWPNGVITYAFDANSKFTQQEKNLIITAMSKISQATNNCIRFTLRTTESAYLNFKATLDGCWSYVGSQQKSQDISISRNGCMHESVVIHEVLHAIGFQHEQTRPDRDKYVRILTQNIESGQEHNFVKYDTATVDTMGFPYDYYSIMHYEWNAFSKNGQATILPIDSKIDYKKMGQSDAMTQIDIQKLLKFYKCPVVNTNVYQVAIKSVSTNKYVCAENSGTEPLVADRTSAQLWEKFDLIYNKEGEGVSLRAKVNNKFVCAENSGNDLLIANRDFNDTWEKFYLYLNSDGTYSFKAIVNGKFFSVLSNSKLKASASSIGASEKFKIEWF